MGLVGTRGVLHCEVKSAAIVGPRLVALRTRNVVDGRIWSRCFRKKEGGKRRRGRGRRGGKVATGGCGQRGVCGSLRGAEGSGWPWWWWYSGGGVSARDVQRERFHAPPMQPYWCDGSSKEGSGCRSWTGLIGLGRLQERASVTRPACSLHALLVRTTGAARRTFWGRQEARRRSWMFPRDG